MKMQTTSVIVGRWWLVTTIILTFLAGLFVVARQLIGSTTDTESPAQPALFAATDAFPNLSFESPVEFTHAGDGSGRLFVVEQEGRIRVFNRKGDAGSAGVFLDIAAQVESGGEMGLLGLAFHPNFAQNGYFYVNYTADDPRRTVVSRFNVNKNDPNRADPRSEQILFTFKQPYSNHNGGKVAFGPDGYLYIATGDGGSAGDPQNNGQDKTAWLGKILRVDVNKPAAGQPYGIPPDNPFANDKNARPEIYAYGLRNPWRFSFDASTGQLWTGDVGQNELEEISIVEKGGNYGWRIKEAEECYNPRNNCPEKGLINPVYQYSHRNGDVSVTGGHVYRGKQLPDLQGRYIFADYASGRVWALTQPKSGPARAELLFKHNGTISAFGEDENRELYFCDHSGGKIYDLKRKGS